MPVLPNALALASIPAGSEIVSADHRNNYAAIQAAVNAIITALAGGSAGQLLEALSAGSVGWGIKITTSPLAGGPPGAPSDGDIWIATGVDTPSASGARWQFQYNAGSASAFKWEFIGGPPMILTPADYNAATSAVSQFQTTANDRMVVPRAGDYRYRTTQSIICDNATNTNPVQFGIAKNGGLIGNFAHAAASETSATAWRMPGSYVLRAAGLAANDLIGLATNVNNHVGVQFVGQVHEMLPIRIS